MPETKPNDFQSLTGDDLWAALDSMPKKQKPKPKARTPKLSWGDTSLVLLIHRTECKCCGSKYEHPNDHLFLKRTANDGSLHYTHLSPSIEDAESRFASLPTETETRVEHVNTCQFCFDLAHCLTRTRVPPGKQSAQAKQISQPPAPTPTLPPELEPLAAEEPSEPILLGLFQTPSTPFIETPSNEN